MRLEKALVGPATEYVIFYKGRDLFAGGVIYMLVELNESLLKVETFVAIKRILWSRAGSGFKQSLRWSWEKPFYLGLRDCQGGEYCIPEKYQSQGGAKSW